MRFFLPWSPLRQKLLLPSDPAVSPHCYAVVVAHPSTSILKSSPSVLASSTDLPITDPPTKISALSPSTNSGIKEIREFPGSQVVRTGAYTTAALVWELRSHLKQKKKKRQIRLDLTSIFLFLCIYDFLRIGIFTSGVLCTCYKLPV